MFKKRLIALAVVLVLMAIGAVTYVAVDGSTYTDRLFWLENNYLTDDDVTVTLDKDDIVQLEKCYLDSNHIVCADYRSLKPGHVKATYNLKNIGIVECELYVNEFGTIFNMDTLNFDGYVYVELLIVTGIALIMIVMLISFIECYRKALFSYSMVGFGGLAMFCAAMITVVVYGMQWMNYFGRFLNHLMITGYLLAIVSTPIMLVLCFAISISNIWLLRHEGFRPQNMLGIALGVLWIGGIFLTLQSYYLFREFSESVSARVSYCLAYIMSFMLCMLLSTIVCAFLSTKRKPDFGRDYIIILGCGIRPDGSLTPILKGRTDAAIKFEKEQYNATGKHAKFVPSGGQGADEVISESEAMARYLKEQGYPEEQIVKEDKSVNTFQNIKFSRDKIAADSGASEGVRAAFATTNYHIFRGYVLSKKHDLNARGISAKTKWYFFPNAFLREFAGLLVDKKYKIGFIVLLMLMTFNVCAQMLSIYNVSY